MQKKLYNVLAVLILSIALSILCSCEEEKPDPRASYEYNVLIREITPDPNDPAKQMFYAGSTVGLGSCAIIGRRAIKERAAQELKHNDWEFVCCWHTKNSKCEEEHDYASRKIPFEKWNKNPANHIKPYRDNF